MRACWLEWVGWDWSISADYTWLIFSDANSVQRHYMPKRPQRKVCLMVNIHAVNMDAARLLKTKVVLTQPMPKVNFLPATCCRSLRLLHKDIEHVLVTRLKVPIKEHARPHTALQKNVAHAHLLMQ